MNNIKINYPDNIFMDDNSFLINSLQPSKFNIR